MSLPTDQEIADECNKLPYTNHLDDGQYNDGVITGFDAGAKWIREKALSDGWVSVEKALPNDNEIVTVGFINTLKEFCVCSAWFQQVSRHEGLNSPKDNRWFVFPSSGHELKPTHWMPLPNKPKQ